MPISLLLTMTAASLLSAPLVGVVNRRLSQGERRHRGLILPAILAAGIYTAFALILINYRFWWAILSLFIMNIPLCTALVTYVVIRLQRHRELLSEYHEQQKAKRPTVAATVAFRASLQGFTVANTTLSPESLHEVVILIKSGTAKEKIAATYDCTLAELKQIEKAFDRYRAAQAEEKGGEDYTVSGEQSELFLQLMANGTPRGLGCGDRLLWNSLSVSRLIYKATKVKPAKTSVLRFLTKAGVIPSEEELAKTKTPEALRWQDTEYRKIRMSALERNAVIFWVFAPASKIKGKSFITALASDGSATFGVYTGTGSFSDFFQKLEKEVSPHPLYAVISADARKIKPSAVPSDTTLFPLGEIAKIPDIS